MTAIYPLKVGAPLAHKLPLMLTVLMASAAFAVVEPSPFDILALLLVVVTALSGVRIPHRLAFPIMLAILFLLANLMSFVEVSNFTKAARYAAISAYMFVIWMLFSALFYHDAETMFRAFWRGYLIAALISALIGIAAFMHLLPDAELFLKHGRAKGLFKDPNVYGPFLVPVVLYVGTRIFSSKHWWKVFYATSLAVLLIGLLLGFSRAAWGNMVMATLVLMATRLAVTRSLRLLVSYLVATGVTIGIIIIAMTALLQIPSVAEMMEKRAALVQSYDVGETGRFGTQQRALLLGLQKPMGTGAGEVRDEFARYPHNVYLLTLVENGWLGMASFTAFLLLQLAVGFRYLRSISHRPINNTVDEGITIVFAVLLTTTLQSLFIDTLHWRHLFFLLGVMMGSIYWAQAINKKTGSVRRVSSNDCL